MTDKATLKFCVDVIADGSPSRRPASLSKSRYATDAFVAEAVSTAEVSRPWISNDGIQGIGIGEKISGGQPTGELAIRAYVDRKRPVSQLANVVPPTLNVGDIEVITDVIAIGELQPEAFTDRVRPVRPGLSISRKGDAPGTLGGFVRRRIDGAIYALSNSHVLADYGRATVGDPIVQPGDSETQATGNDVIGELADFVPFEFSEAGFLNEVDAAISSVEVGHDNVVRLIDTAPRGINIRPRVGMQVQKVGRTSGFSDGVIRDTDFRAVLHYPTRGGNKKRLGFRDQILCTRYTAPGDSGSLVLSSSGLVLGLHYAGSVSASVFCRIANVLAAFDSDMVTG